MQEGQETQGRRGFDPWVWKIPWRRAWLTTPIFLPGDSHGRKGLAGYSPWSGKEKDSTEHKISKPLGGRVSLS